MNTIRFILFPFTSHALFAIVFSLPTALFHLLVVRKPIIDITHAKNKIVICLYVFRALPQLYFETITAYNREAAEKTRLIILHLLQGGIIKKTVSDNGAHYLRLTRKGYDFVSEYFFQQQPLYTFRRDRGVNHKISDHDFYNFVFVWDFITKNPEALATPLKIYDDSNLLESRIVFSYESKRVIISPDIFILHPDEKNNAFHHGLFIENDGGGETYRQLFEKVVEYALLFEQGMMQHALSGATLFFVFHSQKRSEQLLFGEKGILQFFDWANSTRKVKRIPIDVVIKAYTKQKVFFATYQKDHLPTPITFTPYPLASLLLERRPEWNMYL